MNSTIGEPCTWTPEKNTLLCRTVPVNRGRPPAESSVPVGPIIQESFGKAAPAPTFEDLLQSPRDEQLFDYYATSQLAFIDVASGKTTPLGKPGIFEVANPAPNGRYILVARIHHPYSYIRPFENFAHTVEVWDRTGHFRLQTRRFAARLRLFRSAACRQDLAIINGRPPLQQLWRGSKLSTAETRARKFRTVTI